MSFQDDEKDIKLSAHNYKSPIHNQHPQLDMSQSDIYRNDSYLLKQNLKQSSIQKIETEFHSNYMSPAPDQYNIKRLFDENQNNLGFQYKQGQSFGASRETVQFGNPFVIGDNPPPGAYESAPQYEFLANSTKAPSYSLRAQVVSYDDLQDKKMNVPGPGSYKPIGMNQQGLYFNSNFQNYGSCLFNPPTNDRFLNFSNNQQTPGPGSYSTQNLELNPNGFMRFSNYQSSPGWTFGSSPKLPGLQIQQAPGPAYYEIPSQFHKTKKSLA